MKTQHPVRNYSYENLENSFIYPGTPKDLTRVLEDWGKEGWSEFLYDDLDRQPKGWPEIPVPQVRYIIGDDTPWRVEYNLEIYDIDPATNEPKEYPRQIHGLILELAYRLDNQTEVKIECRHPDCEAIYHKILESSGVQEHHQIRPPAASGRKTDPWNAHAINRLMQGDFVEDVRAEWYKLYEDGARHKPDNKTWSKRVWKPYRQRHQAVGS
jgi:hypothetical protein